MFRDFYASKRKFCVNTQVSNARDSAPVSLTTGRETAVTNPPFESPRFNQRERVNEGSHLVSPRANATTLLLSQQQRQRQQNASSLVVQNVEKAKSASRYGNEVLFSASQPRYHQSTPQSPPCFHSRETVEARRRNEEQQRQQRIGGAATYSLHQRKSDFLLSPPPLAPTATYQRGLGGMIPNNDDVEALAMRPMSPPEFTNGTGTVLTAEKRVAVAGTQTDENNNNNNNNNKNGTNANKARQSRRLAGMSPSPVTLTTSGGKSIDESDISKRIASAVEKTLESVARETKKGMEEIAMRTQRDVLRCAADVARMQRDLSEFMSRYGVKRKSRDNDGDDDDVYFGYTSKREIDAKKIAPKKKQNTKPLLLSMIQNCKTPTDAVIRYIQETADIKELRAVNPILFNGAISKASDLKYLRHKISERYMGYAAERAVVPKPPGEDEEPDKENNDIFTSYTKKRNKFVSKNDEDEDDEDDNIELRVREEIAAFQRKTKARTARRRGFAVSTKLSIET